MACYFDVIPSTALGAEFNVTVPGDIVVPELSRMCSTYLYSYGLFAVTDYSDATINRIDLVRNLRSTEQIDTSSYVRCMAITPIPHARKVEVFHDPKLPARVVGVARGNNSRRASIYDKHAQMPSIAPPGLLRFEVRLRRPFLTRKGVSAVKDATPVALEALRRRLWDWARMNAQVAAGPAFIGYMRQAVAHRAISLTQANNLIGAVFSGMESSHPTTRSTHRRILQDLGLVGDPRLHDAMLVQADYESGEIRAVLKQVEA